MSLKKLSPRNIAERYEELILDGSISGSEKAVMVYDSEILRDRFQLLSDAFPESTLHASAVKSNAEPEVLNLIVELGHGLEAASMEEVELAIRAGAPPGRVIFDSPAKTLEEIGRCHKEFPGLIVNANSLEELDRYPADFSGSLGLRINPRVDGGGPSMWNVSGLQSKFGVDIHRREDIVEAFLNYPQLCGLHFHIGSGLNRFEANVEAAKLVSDLAFDIEIAWKGDGQDRRIEFIDIGGGLDLQDDEGNFSGHAFVCALREETKLFNYPKIITEFGKFLHKHNAFAISDVEYILTHQDGSKTAVIHLGADMFVRKVYSDLPVEYPVSVLGRGEESADERYHIAGPLCFSGDYIYHDYPLPKIQPGDKLVIADCGANTISMWSRHCNREQVKFVTC